MRTLHSFMAAVAFLTRLPVPGLNRVDMSAALPASLRWFPLVGLGLGLVAGSAAFVVQPHLRGLVYVLLLLWMTRGLHWDGFADLCDAAGSGASGERFGVILKDSRLGAFGGMGLVAGMGGLALLAAQASFFVLALAPLAGRSLVLPLMLCNGTRAESTLCRLMAPGASLLWAVVHVVLAVGLMCVVCGGARACVLAVLLALIGWRLTALARRTGGMNGDFHGAAIILGEVATLFAATA